MERNVEANNEKLDIRKALDGPKSDGMHLLMERDFDISVLKNYMKQTCLAKRCQFFERGTTKIEDVCRNFLNLLRTEDFNLDEISTIMVAASLSYYVQSTLENIEWRSQFLQKAFEYVDTLSPLHIHVITKRIWDTFKKDDINFAFKLLTLIHCISIANETGRAVAICLTWAILCEITETDIEMHSFHEFNELLKMLNEIDYEMLGMEDNLHIVYILVQCISYLINATVYGINDDFKKAGYRTYFTYSKRDLEKLKKYVEDFNAQLPIKVNATNNNYDLRMTINEYMKMNIIDILDGKINELKINK